MSVTENKSQNQENHRKEKGKEKLPRFESPLRNWAANGLTLRTTKELRKTDEKSEARTCAWVVHLSQNSIEFENH